MPKPTSQRGATKALAKRPRGGQSTYDDVLAAQICELVSGGMSLNAAAKKVGKNESTVREWKANNAEFAAKYARAREDRAEHYFEQILQIANSIGSGEQANIARVQIDAIKWATSKLNPKEYGDRTSHELSGPNGTPIPVSLEIDV